MAQESRRHRLVHGDGARAWLAMARSLRSCMVGPFVPAHRRAPRWGRVRVGSRAAVRNVVAAGAAKDHSGAPSATTGRAPIATSRLMRRRHFIKLAGLAAGTVIAGPTPPSIATPRSPHPHVRPPSPLLVEGITPFVDALPIPATMPITHRIDGVATYDVAMVQI